jgi:hypothetical protein
MSARSASTVIKSKFESGPIRRAASGRPASGRAAGALELGPVALAPLVGGDGAPRQPASVNASESPNAVAAERDSGLAPP